MYGFRKGRLELLNPPADGNMQSPPTEKTPPDESAGPTDRLKLIRCLDCVLFSTTASGEVASPAYSCKAGIGGSRWDSATGNYECSPGPNDWHWCLEAVSRGGQGNG